MRQMPSALRESTPSVNASRFARGGRRQTTHVWLRSRSQLRSQQLLWVSARRKPLTYAAGFRSGRCVFKFFRFFCYERERNIPAYNTPPDNFFILAILVSSTFTAVLTTEKFMPKKHLLHCEILTLECQFPPIQ